MVFAGSADTFQFASTKGISSSSRNGMKVSGSVRLRTRSGPKRAAPWIDSIKDCDHRSVRVRRRSRLSNVAATSRCHPASAVEQDGDRIRPSTRGVVRVVCRRTPRTTRRPRGPARDASPPRWARADVVRAKAGPGHRATRGSTRRPRCRRCTTRRESQGSTHLRSPARGSPATDHRRGHAHARARLSQGRAGTTYASPSSGGAIRSIHLRGRGRADRRRSRRHRVHGR